MLQLQIINLLCWIHVWLSEVLLPVSGEAGFWIEKYAQLGQLGPCDDFPQLFGRGVIPFLMWLTIRGLLKRRNAVGLRRSVR